MTKPRRTFAASFITVALAGCGGGSKPTHTSNPPGPHENPPALSSWTVSQAGNGQCYAAENNVGSEPDQRTIACPDGVGVDVGARVRETAPGVCVAVLDPCGESCEEVSAACPDPEGELPDISEMP